MQGFWRACCYSLRQTSRRALTAQTKVLAPLGGRPRRKRCPLRLSLTVSHAFVPPEVHGLTAREIFGRDECVKE
jgi:predicted component of type VI protein secretion system